MQATGRIVALPPKKERRHSFARVDDYQTAAKAGAGRAYVGRRVRLSEALDGQGCLALGAESPSSNPDIGLSRLALTASTRYPKSGVVESVVDLDGLVELGAFVVDRKPCDPECALCAGFPSEFKGLGDDNA